MTEKPLLRQHLARFQVSRVSHRFTDVLVIGSGVAGLSAAIAATASESEPETTLIAKDALSRCSTSWAQGGIAAVLEPERCHDSIDRHVDDTLRAACGLADPGTVRLVVTEGVERVREIIGWGARFDCQDGAIHFTKEGGHSAPRILHTADRTGREIFRVLELTALGRPNLSCLTETFAIDLLVDDERRCRGALVSRPSGGLQAIWARQTILASGGAGRLYRETTNPPVTTGDGVAMAFRAGATIRDMEFVQFHPTTLYVAGADRFLITEAARGEGGHLVDSGGSRFMANYHPSAELAPRDVVSRGILQHLKETGDNRVFLDLSHLPSERIAERFPYILKICGSFGIDITREPIPVRPSAHYTIGGIKVDHDGATDLPGLRAVGEVSSSGLHGANRLGSNSLLEGLVFGHRAGIAAARDAAARSGEALSPFAPRGAGTHEAPGGTRSEVTLDVQDLQRSLQSLLWRDVGIERGLDPLRNAREQVERWLSYALRVDFDDRAGWTLQNMLTTAHLVIHGALKREETRGVHFRRDFPEAREVFRKHLDLSRADLEPVLGSAPGTSTAG